MNELIKITKDENLQETVNARDLHSFLEVGRDFSNWIKQRIEKYDFQEDSDFTPILARSNGGRPGIEYFISVDMAKELCIRENRSDKIQKALECLGGNINQIHTSTRFETSFLSMLKEALGELGINGIEQYSVNNGKYRIDYYIPKYKTAIEYDEQQHVYPKTLKEDKERQKEIEDKLNCTFIRLNYKQSDIVNVTKVIKFMLTKISEQKGDAKCKN